MNAPKQRPEIVKFAIDDSIRILESGGRIVPTAFARIDGQVLIVTPDILDACDKQEWADALANFVSKRKPSEIVIVSEAVMLFKPGLTFSWSVQMRPAHSAGTLIFQWESGDTARMWSSTVSFEDGLAIDGIREIPIIRMSGSLTGFVVRG